MTLIEKGNKALIFAFFLPEKPRVSTIDQNQAITLPRNTARQQNFEALLSGSQDCQTKNIQVPILNQSETSTDQLTTAPRSSSKQKIDYTNFFRILPKKITQ